MFDQIHVACSIDRIITKVLVIEDNASNIKLIRDLLEATSYEIIRAFSAEEAIKKAEKEKTVFILMDISLHGMDGLYINGLGKTDTGLSAKAALNLGK